MRDTMNSVVSRPMAPLRMTSSLKHPFGVPSAHAPFFADDQVDEGVVEDLEIGGGVDQAADVVVGVLEEPGVHLHLPSQHRLEVLSVMSSVKWYPSSAVRSGSTGTVSR
jgi:hypothetical protein